MIHGRYHLLKPIGCFIHNSYKWSLMGGRCGECVAAVCQIETYSWGNADQTRNNGYIAINGNRLMTTTAPTYRGFNLVQLNVKTCSLSIVSTFDTCMTSTNSDNMANYINGLPLNTVLIGVTADDAQLSLNQNAKSALLAIGVNVDGLQFRGKASFMAQIGRPATSVSQVAPPGGNNLAINVIASGTAALFINYYTVKL